MSVVITLVHGTWGRHSAWTSQSSRLSECLKKCIADEVFLRRFEWSGRNSPSARLNAAEKLRKDLRRAIDEYPAAKQFIIAHSHGGNVALYALRDGNLLANISGLVCLSTPFLYARKRDLGPHLDEMLVLISGYGAMATVLWYTWTRHAPHFLLLLGLAVVMFCIILVLSLWQRISENSIDKFKMPVLPAQKLLILRMSGDEATSALVTSQFFAWLPSRIWLFASQFSGKMRTMLEHRLDVALDPTLGSKWSSRTATIGVIALGLFTMAAFITNGFQGNSIWVIIGEVAGSVLLASIFVVTLFFLAAASSVLANLITAALLLLIVVPVSIAVLPFGPELVLTSFFVEITSEAVPSGASYPVHTFVSHADGSLSHTQTYDDEQALTLLVDWINRSASVPDKALTDN